MSSSEDPAPGKAAALRILYVANGIPVPGTLGGSTHAFEVARGLAQRGHTVHLLAASREEWAGWRSISHLVRPTCGMLAGVHLYHLDIPKALTWLAVWPIIRLIHTIRPDVVMERYYNFSGAGIWAAHRLRIPCLLEVNALMVDPPSIQKRRLDDASGGWMRRWALRQCHMANRIVTPLHTTVPPDIPRSKIIELPWGADIERFAPPAAAETSPDAPPTAVFLGSFRAWHGVLDVIRAAAILLAMGRTYHFLLVGDGPQRAEAETLAAAWPGHFHFTGAVPYEQVPALLRRATVGVAPFATAPHPALQAAGFFWSPLKIYEYMASGLPVVTTDLHPLNMIIREGQEGALFHEGDIADLAAALDRLLADPLAAQAAGARARARVVEHYSWQHHCAALEQVLGGLET
jgi:glycosyltransferase involved in cell wall biosynthesis